jgi:hypothetical protein
MSVASFFRKYNVGCILNYVRLIIIRENHVYIQDVSANIFEPNNSVIFERIFVKFKMQIF